MQKHFSKTKNFIVYRYLLNYPTEQEALDDLDNLAQLLNRHKNGIISCIAQPKKNPRIYQELRAFGYADTQIPAWFIRPLEESQPPSEVDTVSKNQNRTTPSGEHRKLRLL